MYCVGTGASLQVHIYIEDADDLRSIQWPPWLKMDCRAPQKRNGQSTLGLPMHMGGVRQAARCPYGAAEPSWAMVRCYSSSHPPILYTACVGSYNFSHIIY